MALWNNDTRPQNNTLASEIERLGRIIVALTVAYEEKRNKHVRRDLYELNLCYSELKSLLNDKGEPE